MGCTSNSSVEVNKIEKDEKNFEEPLEAEELPIIFNKEKKTTNFLQKAKYNCFEKNKFLIFLNLVEFQRSIFFDL